MQLQRTLTFDFVDRERKTVDAQLGPSLPDGRHLLPNGVILTVRSSGLDHEASVLLDGGIGTVPVDIGSRCTFGKGRVSPHDAVRLDVAVVEVGPVTVHGVPEERIAVVLWLPAGFAGQVPTGPAVLEIRRSS